MISENLVSNFKPHKKVDNSDITPEYFFAIKDITDKSDNVCKEGIVTFRLVQINQKLESLFDGYNTIKDFTIKGKLDADEEGNFSTGIIGYENDVDDDVDVNAYASESEFSNTHYIETVQAPLEKEFFIKFNYEYKEMPSVIVNIDANYEHLYRSYSTSFDSYVNQDEQEHFTGVTVTFNNLKIKRKYPDVKITIIGDSIQETEEAENAEDSNSG